jgi:hypothetical protein
MAGVAQKRMPLVAFTDPGDSNGDAFYVTAFRKALNKTGFIKSTNVTIEIDSLEGKFDRVSVLTAELVKRQSRYRFHDSRRACSQAATSTVPIVFASSGGPVKLGLLASLNRPGDNVTGVNFFGVGPVNSTRKKSATEAARQMLPAISDGRVSLPKELMSYRTTLDGHDSPSRRPPPRWHSHGGGAVHSITSGHSNVRKVTMLRTCLIAQLGFRAQRPAWVEFGSNRPH